MRANHHKVKTLLSPTPSTTSSSSLLEPIGAAIDACGVLAGSANTPRLLVDRLQNDYNLTFKEILNYDGHGHDIPHLRSYFEKLAHLTYASTLNKRIPLVIGGDHSCAIGTWAGILKALASANNQLGLIWVDAHMDSHTPDTSKSGNIHGMPLAHLLGYGYNEFLSILDTFPRLSPQNLVLIGIRSFEEGEAELLKRLGVKVYYNHQVHAQGANHVLLEAWHHLKSKVNKIGFSIDVDGFDPKYAPGVGTKEPHGVDFIDFMTALNQLDKNDIAGIEITEANFHLDHSPTTINCVLQLIQGFHTLID